MSRGVAAVQDLLPHRYPMLLVDRLLECSPGRCVALKNVSADEPFLPGHLPGRPIFPASMMIEAMAQTGAFLALGAALESGAEPPALEPPQVFLVEVTSRILKPVTPGDRLILTARLVDLRRSLVRFRCDVDRENERVATGRFLTLLVEEP